ncbi:Endoglucanase-4 [Drechslerella dactyloides]|uniref:AA9 family lytic polysaccharide monooxygenase n=1 Tax=Drechslerella dactyloides TaxID=74499 RepID=A0AAD6IYN1_DREDA|nr:Endoglucanase-4 [Drechslerella dactyloides]
MVALSKLAAAVALAGSASAHTIFQQLWVNGVAAGQNVGIRVPTYNGPITDVLSNDIICNGGVNPLATPLPSAIINVPSGATLTMEWHHGGNGPDPNDASDPVDPSHKGPIMVYLAKVDSALTTSVTGLKWFKIYEDGLNVATNTWAVDKFYAAKGFVDFKIPTCIPPGNYLLRGELLALHGAGSYPGAQFYMSCAQINIVGGGTSSPPTVNFPGAYSGSDPGILVNIYYPPLSTYVIPGPRPFTCGGSSPTSTTSARTSSATTTSRTTTASSRTTTTSSRTTATSSPRTSTTTSRTTTPTTRTTTGATGGAPLYGQCGGIGWTGPTTCASGTCKYSNEYYSQCL